MGGLITTEVLDDLETNGWELYHVAEDPAEVHNLAAEHPEKLRELVSLWWAEAGKYKVLPIDGSLFERSVAERPQLTQERSQYVFYPDLSVVPMGTAPKVFNRPHSITADVTIPDGGAEGVLLAQGGVAGGFVLYVKDGKLHYVHNYLGLHEYKVTSTKNVPKGRAKLRYEFEPTGKPDIANGKGAPGRGQLYFDGKLVGNAEFDMTVPLIFGIEGLSCGYDFGEAVTPRLPRAVPLHRDDSQRDGGRLGRVDQGRRSRDAHADGAAVSRHARHCIVPGLRRRCRSCELLYLATSL